MARRGAGVVRTQTTDLLGLLPPTPGHLLRTPLFIDRWGGLKILVPWPPPPGLRSGVSTCGWGSERLEVAQVVPEGSPVREPSLPQQLQG